MSRRGAAALRGRLRSRRLPAILALSGLLLILASTATAAAGTLAPAYVGTLGGPGHAGMYPSGMEIVPTDSTTQTAGTPGNVVVADTGNDRVAEYSPPGGWSGRPMPRAWPTRAAPQPAAPSRASPVRAAA